MTKRFAQNQLKDLKAHLQLIQKEYDSLKEELGEEWIEAKVYAILDEIIII
ncbi:MAG: hypothetical protein AAF806_28850 [Bacteroidota bacterium]